MAFRASSGGRSRIQVWPVTTFELSGHKFVNGFAWALPLLLRLCRSTSCRLARPDTVRLLHGQQLFHTPRDRATFISKIYIREHDALPRQLLACDVINARDACSSSPNRCQYRVCLTTREAFGDSPSQFLLIAIRLVLVGLGIL